MQYLFILARHVSGLNTRPSSGAIELQFLLQMQHMVSWCS